MSNRAEPNLVPREAPFDAAGYPVPSSNAFFADLSVDAGEMSTVVEHVTNTEYVRWLDRAAELHADGLGLTRAWLLANGIMWFVARHEIDYLAEAHLGDRLVVATWVRDVERVKSWREYTIIRPDDGRVVCRAATLWVLVDLATRRPRRLPSTMKDRLASVVAPPLTERSGRRDAASIDRAPPCTSP